MEKLNKQQQRWLALGLLLGLIFLFSAIIFIPWYNALHEKLENVEREAFKINRYERVIASKYEVSTGVDQARKKINELNYFFSHETNALAEAELQTRIKEIAQHANGEISSTQVLPQKDVDNLVRIAVKVKLLGDMEMLRTILHEIEVEKPFMIIDEISIIPRRGRRNRKTRQIEETGKVTVTLEVSSYMRKKSADTN